MTQQHTDAVARPPLALGPRLLYASAHFGVSALAFTMINWSTYFYGGSLERGFAPRMDMALFGVALLFGRLLDAVIDPLVGIWSDRTRTRWGRRKPFVLAGIIPVCLGFVLIWWTPTPEPSTVNFLYLLGVLTMFYFGFTLVSCPYLALLPEIVRSDRERVGLAALQAVFNVLGDIVGAVVGGILIGRMGFTGMGLFIAALSAVTFVLGLLGPRDDPHQEPPPAMSLRSALGHTFRNRHFVHYGLAFLTFWIGLTVVVAAVPFLVSELLHRSEAEAGVVTGVVLIAAVACLPLTTWASARWGKRRTFLASLLWFTALAPFPGTVGRWPVPLDGFAQAIVLMVLAGPPVSGLLVLPYALLAEVTDDDERVTGTRREATYFGVNGMLYKAGLALGGAVAAWVFAAFGKTAAEPLGLYLAGPVAGGFALLGWALFRGYGLPMPTREARRK